MDGIEMGHPLKFNGEWNGFTCHSDEKEQTRNTVFTTTAGEGGQHYQHIKNGAIDASKHFSTAINCTYVWLRRTILTGTLNLALYTCIKGCLVV